MFVSLRSIYTCRGALLCIVDLLHCHRDEIEHLRQMQLDRAEEDANETSQRILALENQIKVFREEIQRTNESSPAIEKLTALLNKVSSLRDETLRATASAEHLAPAPANQPISIQRMVGTEENGRDPSFGIEQSEMQSLASAVRPPVQQPPLRLPAQNSDFRTDLNEAKDELKQVVNEAVEKLESKLARKMEGESNETQSALGQIFSAITEEGWALKGLFQDLQDLFLSVIFCVV